VKAANEYPIYASGNTDFTDSMRTRLAPGEQVIVLDVEADELPSGTLCLHQDTVAEMVHALGWKLASGSEVLELEHRLAVAEDQVEAYAELRKAISRVKVLA